MTGEERLSTHPIAAPEGGSRREGDDWQELASGLLAGLHHAMNNRVGSLSGIAQVLEGEMGAEDPLRLALAREVELLHRTTGLISLLGRRRSRRSEPLAVEEVLESAVSLYRLHHELREVPCTVRALGPVLPLCGDQAGLTQIVVAVAAMAGSRAAGLEGGGVEITYRGDETHVYLGVEAAAGRVPFNGAPASAPQMEIDAAAVTEWVRREGGELAIREEAGGEAVYTVRLPTLPEVRRRERESVG